MKPDPDKAKLARETYRVVGVRNCDNCGNKKMGIRSQSSFAIRNKCYANWCPMLADFVRGMRTECDAWEQA